MAEDISFQTKITDIDAFRIEVPPSPHKFLYVGGGTEPLFLNVAVDKEE